VGVLVHQAVWNTTDCITYGEASDILAHGIDDTGSFVSQTCRKFYGVITFDKFVIAPHYLATARRHARRLHSSSPGTQSISAVG
jgi:hypothetical protein